MKNTRNFKHCRRLISQKVYQILYLSIKCDICLTNLQIFLGYFSIILALVSLLWYYFFEQYSFVSKLLYIFLNKNIIRVFLTTVYCSFTFLSNFCCISNETLGICIHFFVFCILLGQIY